MAESQMYQEEPNRLCNATAFLLCLMHILSVAGVTYQDYIHHPSPVTQDDFVGYFIWLCPVFVLLVLKIRCFAVIFYVMPISAIFFGRVNSVWVLTSTGVNSIVPKGDLGTIAMSFLGAFSAGVLAIWMLVHIFSFANRNFRLRTQKLNGENK